MIALWLAMVLTAASVQSEVPDPLPDLSAPVTPADARASDRYFYFHRTGADFATALGDLEQCDALASGLTPGTGRPAFGGAALAGLSAAIANGNRKALRRINLRRCMFFKGYGRYAVSMAAWERFNGDDGASDPAEWRRLLTLQARIASGPAPRSTDLGE